MTAEPAKPRRTSIARRRQLALAELVMGVAGSFAVTEPGSEKELRERYGLTQADMDKLKESLGERLEAWAERLGYAQHWDRPCNNGTEHVAEDIERGGYVGRRCRICGAETFDPANTDFENEGRAQ